MQDKNSLRNKIVGMNIAKRLDKLGINQKEFADLVYITQGYLSEIINFKKTPRSKKIRQIEDKLASLEEKLKNFSSAESSDGDGKIKEAGKSVAHLGEMLQFDDHLFLGKVLGRIEELYLEYRNKVGDRRNPQDPGGRDDD